MRQIAIQILLIGIMGVLLPGGCSRPGRVLLTGYWPPTNAMLREFSPDADLNPDGWQGANWRGLGYDVYAYFPTFEQGTDVNPAGDGDFRVDYQATRADFERVTRQLRPSMIICYGRGNGPWEIEQNAVYRARWHDDYHEPRQPGDDCPLSGRYHAGDVLKLTLPAEEIEAAVSQAAPQLKVWTDTDGDPGDFLCNYLAFLAADYQLNNKHCKIAGFIHVGPEVDPETAHEAQQATLRAVIEAMGD